IALTPVAKMLIALGAAIVPIVVAVLEKLTPIIEWIIQHAPFVAQLILTIVGAIKAWIIVQAIINALMTANPIGLIITALAALVIGIIAAYNHFEGFRKVVDAVFRAIAGVAIWLFDNILKPAFNWIANTAAPAIGVAISWLWNNVFKPVFTAIGTIAVWLFDNVLKPGWANLVWIIENLVAPIMTWLWSNVFKPIFTFIGEIVNWWWNNITKPVFEAFGRFISNVVGPSILWLWNSVVSPAFNFIGAIISTTWRNFIAPVFRAW